MAESLKRTGVLNLIQVQIFHVGERSGDVKTSVSNAMDLSQKTIKFRIAQVREGLNLFLTIFVGSFILFFYAGIYIGYTGLIF